MASQVKVDSHEVSSPSKQNSSLAPGLESVVKETHGPRTGNPQQNDSVKPTSSTSTDDGSHPLLDAANGVPRAPGQSKAPMEKGDQSSSPAPEKSVQPVSRNNDSLPNNSEKSAPLSANDAAPRSATESTNGRGTGSSSSAELPAVKLYDSKQEQQNNRNEKAATAQGLQQSAEKAPGLALVQQQSRAGQQQDVSAPPVLVPDKSKNQEFQNQQYAQAADANTKQAAEANAKQAGESSKAELANQAQQASRKEQQMSAADGAVLNRSSVAGEQAQNISHIQNRPENQAVKSEPGSHPISNAGMDKNGIETKAGTDTARALAAGNASSNLDANHKSQNSQLDSMNSQANSHTTGKDSIQGTGAGNRINGCGLSEHLDIKEQTGNGPKGASSGDIILPLFTMPESIGGRSSGGAGAKGDGGKRDVDNKSSDDKNADKKQQGAKDSDGKRAGEKPDSKSDGKATASKADDARSTDSKNANHMNDDARSNENKNANNKNDDSRNADTKIMAGKADDRKPVDSRVPAEIGDAGKSKDGKGTAGKDNESRQTDKMLPTKDSGPVSKINVLINSASFLEGKTLNGIKTLINAIGKMLDDKAAVGRGEKSGLCSLVDQLCPPDRNVLKSWLDERVKAGSGKQIAFPFDKFDQSTLKQIAGILEKIFATAQISADKIPSKGQSATAILSLRERLNSESTIDLSSQMRKLGGITTELRAIVSADSVRAIRQERMTREEMGVLVERLSGKRGTFGKEEISANKILEAKNRFSESGNRLADSANTRVTGRTATLDATNRILASATVKLDEKPAMKVEHWVSKLSESITTKIEKQSDTVEIDQEVSAGFAARILSDQLSDARQRRETEDREKLLKERDGEAELVWSPTTGIYRDCVRIVESRVAYREASGEKISLQLCVAGSWLPVFEYEIYSDKTLMHRYKRSSGRVTTVSSLAPEQAKQMAGNHLRRYEPIIRDYLKSCVNRLD